MSDRVDRRWIRLFSNDPNAAHLGRLVDLVDNSSIRPVLGPRFALDDLDEAHYRIERGGIRGKVVVTT